ncbi:BON domain-containing protein [Neosynechococcus sphagnicola]|uniref:BON domain-containing protein n=1 Tax=Neosynechococcus sphagnicola TaxID=1501145 RepID=UPI00069112EE|nr:BON domain-containing protein [Neosynechococcus sphagnicola]
MNASDRENSARVIYREYKDTQGNIRTEYKDAQGNIHSYENSYMDSQVAEEKIQDIRVERTERNLYKGILIGVIVTCVSGLTAGTIYFLTQVNKPLPTTFISLPVHQSTSSPSPAPQQVRLVQKPIVTIVPVPQAQAPRSTVNITTQPSATNPSSNPGNVSATNPSQNSGATDSNLKNEIMKKFQNNLPNNQLIVEVKNGEVTISGTAASPEQLQQIQPLLRSIQGIRKVNMVATAPSKM